VPEILGLRWEDVDLEARTVRIAGELSRSRELAEVKTERGRRTFGLPELALYALKAQRAQQAHDRLAAGSGWQDGGYVFTMKDGRPVGWRSLGAVFIRAQARAGVRRQRFHDQRHAFTALLLDAGEEIAVISKMLGHADYSTTVDVYSHLSRERSRVAAARRGRADRRPAQASGDTCRHRHVGENCGQNCGQGPPPGQPAGAASCGRFGRGGRI